MLVVAAPDLLASVRALIEAQLSTQPKTRGSTSNEDRDEFCRRLVGEALAAGSFGRSVVSDPEPFQAGNTAMMVGSLTASLSYVVKVDGSKKVVREARLLQRIATDLELPESLRRAFPAIYAVADAPPLRGYLMEHLDGYQRLHETLQTNPAAAGQVLSRLWDDLLLPAYERTVTERRPGIAGDYIGRVQERFRDSKDVPLPDRPLRIEATPEPAIDIPGGWGDLLDRAKVRVAELAPPFGTFVHGDPNPENIMWLERGDETLDIRLIDPKDWWIGDPLFDIAKIGHYLRVTGPVEHHGHTAEYDDSAGTAIVRYDANGLDEHQELETALLAAYGQSAKAGKLRDESWEERYEFAVASNLLGIVAPRAAKGGSDVVQRNLARIAFGEGLRLLAKHLP